MIPTFAMLAQSGLDLRVRGLRSGFTDRRTDAGDVRMLVLLIVIPLAMVGLFFALRLMWQRYKERHSTQHPMRLFEIVLSKLGFNIADRWMLRALARSAGLAQPTVLLFSRELFDNHADRWVGAMTVQSLREHVRQRLRHLAEIAFPAAESAGTSAA